MHILRIAQLFVNLMWYFARSLWKLSVIGKIKEKMKIILKESDVSEETGRDKNGAARKFGIYYQTCEQPPYFAAYECCKIW